MQYKTIGKSDIKVSRMAIGCWSYGGGSYWGQQSQQDVDAVVHQALDTGINCFDTAEVYNDGNSEIALGKALKGRRSDAVIITKIKTSNCKNVRKTLEASLNRLGTDYVDVYMVHWPFNYASIKHFTDDADILNNPPTAEETFHQLSMLKKEGLIRSIGISNFGVQQMTEALKMGADIDLNELSYNILSRAIEKEIAPFCTENNISILGYSALQQGLLTGKYASLDQLPPPQAHSRHFSQKRGGAAARHGEEGAEAEINEVLSTLRRISADTGIPVHELSLGWMMGKPFIDSVLVGCRNTEQFSKNLTACQRVLSPDIMQEIDRVSLPVWEKLGDSPDYYENRKNSRTY